jgi:predicted RNA-binding protein with PUA-like domain
MAYWLLKTEPEEYSFSDLEKEGHTVWNGVTNNWALKFIREIKKGDQVFIYHTGKDKKIVGIALVTSGIYPDPQKKDPKLPVFDVKPVYRLFGRATLKRLKSDPYFSDFLLVKFTRLSVLPVEEKYWTRILKIDKIE